jgi:hypothetical protein
VASGVAYGTDELADMCRVLQPGSGARRLGTVARAIARRPRRAQTLLSLCRLPIVEPRLSGPAHDRWLRARWPAGGEPLFGGHWAQAVIQTSAREHEYLAGRHRQAVRTNIHRARELGITATRLGGYDEFAAACAPVYRSRPGGEAVLAAMRRPPVTGGELVWYSASTPAHEAPVIVAVVGLFGDFGVLAVMVGNLDYDHVGYARYLMHTFILGDLAAHGIRHLIVGSVLRESAGNQYFQRLLGYRICNLRPILLPPPGNRGTGTVAAATRRRLMTGPLVETPPPTSVGVDADGSAPKDSRRTTPAPSEDTAGRGEWTAIGDGLERSSAPGIALTSTGSEDRESSL